jgi:hypothetical protein
MQARAVFNSLGFHIQLFAVSLVNFATVRTTNMRVEVESHMAKYMYTHWMYYQPYVHVPRPMACTNLYISMMWVHAKENVTVGSARRPAVSIWSKEPADRSVARHADGAICSDDNHNSAVFFKTVHFSNVFLLVSTVRKRRWRRSIFECVIIASNFVDWLKKKLVWK